MNLLVSLVFLVLCFSSNLAKAQSLIVGIPSSDTTPKQKKALAFELQSRTSEKLGDELSGFLFSTYGVSESLELGVSVLNLSNSGKDQNDSLILGYKKNKTLKENDSLKVVGAIGQMAGPSLVGGPLAHWHYALVSQEFRLLGVRLTQGLSYANRTVYGQNVPSLMLGLEHRWSEHWMGVIDWYSGDHDYAAAIYAVQFRPVHEFLVFLGWKQPNIGGAGSVMTEMAYEF